MAYCISATLAGIGMDCSASLGGIKKVYITHYAEDIFTLGSGDTEGKVTAIKSGVTFNEYLFRAESSNFTSTLNKSAEGSSYVSTEIALSFARMDTAKRIEMNALALDDLAVIVVDNNNKKWVFGIDRPVTTSAGTGETGQAYGDANRYTVTLFSTDGLFAPELNDDVVIPTA